jgi:hypothetical protein
VKLKKATNKQITLFIVLFFFLVEGFDVSKTGDARIGLIGFPSVGKSTLLTKLTGTFSEVAAYEFTTLTCVPGKLLASFFVSCFVFCSHRRLAFRHLLVPQV